MVLKTWQFWLLTALAVVAAALMAANMLFFHGNRKMQTEVNGRAQYIQQSAQLEQLGRDIALSLAQLGVRNQDEQIRAMLNALGITVNVNQAGQPAPTLQGGRKP